MPTKFNKRASGEGNIRQRANGTWEGRYTIGADPATGKQTQKSVYGKTQKEVRQKLQQIAHALETGEYTAPSRLTVSGWLSIWASEYMNAVKDTTAEQYKYQIRVHIVPAFGALRLQELTAPIIQRLYNCKVQEGLSPKSVKNMHGVLHKALAQAVKLGYIRVNPAEACDLPRIEPKTIKPLEGEHISAFLEAIKGTRFENLYTVTLFTGMREGEILGLTWSCVDFEKGVITVEKQLQRERVKGGVYRFVPLKNDKTRLITAPPSVMTVLRAQRQTQAENRLRFGGAWNNARDLVFTDEIGNNLSKNTVYETFKRIAREIGLEDLRFHDLRHTYATLAIQSGDDIKTVSENLGHATVAFTLDVYGHVSETMKQNSAARMESIIQTVKR